MQLVDICVGQKIVRRIVFVEDEAEGGAGAHEDGKEAEGDATGNEEGDDGDKGDGDKGADGKGEDGKGNDGDKGDDGKGDDGDGDEGDEAPAKSTSPYVAVTSLSAKNGEYIPGCSVGAPDTRNTSLALRNDAVQQHLRGLVWSSAAGQTVESF